MTLRPVLLLAFVGLGLAGCANMNNAGFGAAAPAGASQGSSLQGLPVFLDRLDAARGSAMPVADRIAVGGMAAESRNLLDGTQNRFIDAVGQRTGMGGDTLRLLVPSAAAPVSGSEVVTKAESKLGRHLSGADSAAIEAAAALRNNSLASLKDGLADKVGARTGVGKDTVLALLPLLGM